MFISLPAAILTRRMGRKITMLIASIFFLVGSGINAGAVNVAMLIVGRILLGFGIGSANSVVPLYLSEAAPHKWRGAMTMLFQLTVTIGIFAACESGGRLLGQASCLSDLQPDAQPCLASRPLAPP